MVGFKPTNVPPTVGVKFVAAGTAACMADMVTFPLDTAKVRLQIQGETSGSNKSKIAVGKNANVKPLYRGMYGTIMTISRQEGARALYNGLVAGLHRQMGFASVRIGLYDSVKHFYQNASSQVLPGGSIVPRILAGITTGGIAVTIAQPTDVVKVRLQAQTGTEKRYQGAMLAYRKIAREEGIKGLWKGTAPNVTRTAVVNATELVCYDSFKEKIISMRLMSDNLPCHFVSAFCTGFVTTCVASPVDVVKTRFMNSSEGQYKSAMDCAVRMFKEGGTKAFFKG
nr:PREDICTED: mitochondrial uncoupling protein 2-like isoform X1 [Saccoglossus kowalevskii]